MITPLAKTALHDLLNKPILFDANIFMVGIENRISDENCSFENMKRLYIRPLYGLPPTLGEYIKASQDYL